MSWLGIYLLGIVGGAVATLVLAWRLRSSAVRERGWMLFVPLATVAVLGRWLQTLLDAPNFDWAGARLAPLVACTRGYQLYYGPLKGPVLNTIYAPLSYLIYTPTLLLRDPTWLILGAGVIGLVAYFLPVILLCALRGRRQPESWILPFFGLVLFVFLSFHFASLRMSLEGTIHDTPALGGAALACWFLYRDPLLRWHTLVFSAFCTVLAIWAKQVMAPLALVLPLWTLLVHDRRRALLHLGLLALFGVFVSGVMALLFPARAMAFNILQLPASHPWNGVFPSNLLGVASYFYQEIYLLIAALAIIVLLERRRSTLPWSLWLGQQRWMLFALVGIANISTAFLGRVKLGGSWNSFSLTVYFLLLAGLAYLLQRFEDPSELGQRIRVALGILTAAIILFQLQEEARFFKDYLGLNRSKEERVYRFVTAHPGVAYFPWNPLPELLVEGKLCHFAYGLFDREIGGFPLDAPHFQQHVPPHCRYVCFPAGRRDHRPPECLDRYLKDFTRRVELNELPGFECYERNP